MEGSGTGRNARLLEPFRNSKSRRLLWAFLSSELGDGLTQIVIPLGVYAASDSVFALAGTFLGRLLLASVFAAAGGAIADRWDRKRILLVSILVRAALVGVLVVVPSDAAAAFALVGILVGAAGAFDNPSAEAALRVVYRHDLQSLAVARKFGKAFSALVGPALGGLLFGLGGIHVALGVNVALFLVALFILIPDSPHPPGTEPSPKRKQGQRVDWSLLRRVPLTARLAFFSTLATSFLVSFSIVVAVPYLDDLPRAPEGAYGYSIAAYSAGALLGLWLAGLITWRRLSLRAILIAANFIYGVLVVVSVVTSAWELLPIAWLLWGVVFGPEDVVADARVSAIVPDRWLGRVYAWWSIIGKTGSALAFAAAMFLENADGRNVLIAVGVGYAVLVPVVLSLIRGEERRPPSAGPNTTL